jgi:SAM-dependent methyltransferase
MDYPAETDSVAQEIWEEAYRQFGTPEEEIRKFIGRLKKVGAGRWPKDVRIVELFCGRGNGMHALERLGFSHVEGIDLSARLLAEYRGRSPVHVGDCRQLPFENESRDILIVQGGLHHLAVLPDDLRMALAEAHRVLRREGLLVAVEPWPSLFLSLVHALCRLAGTARFSRKLCALATMIRYEQGTYGRWLSQSSLILGVFREFFRAEQLHYRFGKMYFVGRKNNRAK